LFKFESNSMSSGAMPRYYFHVIGPPDFRDRFGLIRYDDAAAIAWAQNVADALHKRGASASAVVVTHEDGREVARIPALPALEPLR
jgi:hypothetical protein